jgi:hypothetical protein
MAQKSKSVHVFGRLKDELGNVVFTCSASAGVVTIASDECVRLAKTFVAAKPKTGCGCSKKAKPSYKIQMCECCETHLVESCNGTTVVVI